MPCGENCATSTLFAVLRKSQDLRIIRLLPARGADPAECVSVPGKWDWIQTTPLHEAAERGYVDAIAIFIETGITKLDTRDIEDNTPLLLAATNGQQEVVNMLIEGGAKPDSKNEMGFTPLMAAAYSGSEAVARLLITKGVKIDAVDIYSYTALAYAAKRGNEDIVRPLLTRGAKSDIRTTVGKTALALATSAGHDPVARLLRTYVG